MSNPEGYYYLHTNGDLIYKPARVLDGDASYFDSPFVRKVWPIHLRERESAWILCVEALAMGAKEERVRELATKWGLTDEDAQVFAERVRLILRKDGNKWMAAGQEFVNVQESQTGWGDTCLDALVDYVKNGRSEGRSHRFEVSV